MYSTGLFIVTIIIATKFLINNKNSQRGFLNGLNLDKYPFERYESPYPLSYKLKSTTTVLLWH